MSKEDVELSAPLEYTSPFGEKIVFRLSIYKGETETGFTRTNGLQLNVEIGGEPIAHAFLENDVADDEEDLGEGRSGWSLDGDKGVQDSARRRSMGDRRCRLK
jgi:hypothetical protein